MKAIVFDLGGTLMQYVGMPYSWVDFYNQGFEAIIQKYNCNIPKEDVEKSIQLLKEFNPRVQCREVEYTPEYIFSNIMEHWHVDIPIQDCIETFWDGLNLNAEIYPDTIEVLSTLKGKGYCLAALTDLPNAMPDEIFKSGISEMLKYFDYYVSSSVVGYRKPHNKGLQMISDKFGIPITELLFVGDEEKDRKTALNAKCKFIHIHRTENMNGGISDLYELLEVIERGAV